MQGARKSSAAFSPRLMLPWVMWLCLHPTNELGALALYFVGSLPLLCKDLPWDMVAALRDS